MLTTQKAARKKSARQCHIPDTEQPSNGQNSSHKNHAGGTEKIPPYMVKVGKCLLQKEQRECIRKQQGRHLRLTGAALSPIMHILL